MKEFSPSGQGIHILCCGLLAKGMRHGPVEVYSHGRYFTVTADILPGCETIQAAQSALDWLTGLIRPAAKQNAGQGKSRLFYSSESDSAIVERAMSARNGEKFRRLWSGDTSDYPSHSEADLGLLSMLLFWCHDIEPRAETLFRQSGLYRAKADRPDYLKRCFAFLRGRRAS